MNLSRRRFILACGAAGMAAGFVPVGGASARLLGSADQIAGPKKGTVMLKTLSRAVFEPLVDTSFHVSDGAGQAAAMKLVEVSAGRASSGFESYSLLFLGPARPSPAQGTYRFEHPDLGRFDIFIVPIGRKGEGVYYEAIFNRSRPSS